ncbi:AAA family ATPase [Bifidobacterium sp. ESL0704]|uniref:AAA family ATPase n=1 Tax=Bifidobacterium sp. ESL0704 TaxID=2983219 RepID=UPI0023F8FABA|nr:AAA family ATPase [Bifidobacterium sp. ESL0704]WEV53476.1 AAA family ATPase [Bifidobacterium sp. ESL0704]
MDLKEVLQISDRDIPRTFVRLELTDGRNHWKSDYRLDHYAPGNRSFERMNDFDEYQFSQIFKEMKIDRRLPNNYEIPKESLFLIFARIEKGYDKYLFVGYRRGNKSEDEFVNEPTLDALLGHVYIDFRKQDAADVLSSGKAANRLQLFSFEAVNQKAKVNKDEFTYPYDNPDVRKANFEKWLGENLSGDRGTNSWIGFVSPTEKAHEAVDLLEFPEYRNLHADIESVVNDFKPIFGISDSSRMHDFIENLGIVTTDPDNQDSLGGDYSDFYSSAQKYYEYLATGNKQEFTQYGVYSPSKEKEEGKDTRELDAAKEGQNSNGGSREKDEVSERQKSISEMSNVTEQTDDNGEEFQEDKREKEEILKKAETMARMPNHPIKNLSYNTVWFGAPGTGKSHSLNKIVKSCFGDRSERVTFYADYQHADFVGTYKPVMQETGIQYCFVPGPFIRVLERALNDPGNNYALVIEELNRAETASVFGELFQLLDRDGDGVSWYPVSVSVDCSKYLSGSGLSHNAIAKRVLRNLVSKCMELEENQLAGWEECTRIVLPGNMYILATMNSADQGVYLLDTAFKRRWNFKYIDIDAGENDMSSKEKSQNEWWTWRKKINTLLRNCGVSEDKQLGPFFLDNAAQDGLLENPDSLFNEAMKSKVIMYLFEDAARYNREDVFNVSDILKESGDTLAENVRGSRSDRLSLSMLFRYWDSHHYEVFNNPKDAGANDETSDSSQE